MEAATAAAVMVDLKVAMTTATMLKDLSMALKAITAAAAAAAALYEVEAGTMVISMREHEKYSLFSSFTLGWSLFEIASLFI